MPDETLGLLKFPFKGLVKLPVPFTVFGLSVLEVKLQENSGKIVL
jgi:hypothetical protein